MIEQNKYNNDALKLRIEHGVGKKVELSNAEKQEKIQQINESILRKEEIIKQTTEGIEKIRESLGMGPSTEIPPSILSEQISLEKIKKEKSELEIVPNVQETNKEIKREELINENDPEYKKFLENESLELLKKHDLEYFNKNYSGVGENGFLIDKEGNQTSSLPSQNIGGSLGGIKYSSIKEDINNKFLNRQSEEKKVADLEISKSEYNPILEEKEISQTFDETIKQNEQKVPEIIQQQILEKISEELQNQPEIKEEVKTAVEDLQEQPKEINENKAELNEAEKHFESVKNEEKIEEIKRFEGNMKTSLEDISNSGMKVLDALNERQGMRLTPFQNEDDFYRMVSLFKSLSNNETKFDVSTLEDINQSFQNLGNTFEEMEFQNRGGISESLDNLERLSYSLRDFASVCDDVSRKLPTELPDKQVEELVLQLKNTLQVVDQKSNEAWLKVTRRRDILG